MAQYQVLSAAFLILATVSGEPFFGNNYIIPQGAELGRYSNAVVTNLNSARNSLGSYIRSPPVHSVALNQGARTLVDYVGNVSQLVGNVYTQIARASSDRTSSPVVVFSNIQIHVKALQPLLKNSSSYISSIAKYFDYDGSNATSRYFSSWASSLRDNELELEDTLKQISQVLDSISGQSLNTREFIAALSTDGLLQNLLDVVQQASILASDFSNVISRLVAAINTANNFRSSANSRIQSSRYSTNSAVNGYIRNTNVSFNSIITAADNALNNLRTLNDSFAFRWPLLFSEQVEHKFNLLNKSIDSLVHNLNFRRGLVEEHFLKTSRSFIEENQPLSVLELESEHLTRALTNVIEPDSCVSEFRNTFLDLPESVRKRLSQCIDSQLTLERQGANQVVSIGNNFLRTYTNTLYAGLELCFDQPYERMNDCLDHIVKNIDFSGKFFLLDTVSFYLYDQVQSELINCNAKLLDYVHNVGLMAECGTIAA